MYKYLFAPLALGALFLLPLSQMEAHGGHGGGHHGGGHHGGHHHGGHHHGGHHHHHHHGHHHGGWGDGYYGGYGYGLGIDVGNPYYYNTPVITPTVTTTGSYVIDAAGNTVYVPN